jgi:hypothetical protein
MLYPQAKQQVKTNDSANKGLEAHVEQSKPTSSPTPSVKPVAAKNEAMNPSRQISKEILDTPVTEAIKYLFFNKKKNKDIDRLNDIISYVNENMPADFPVEQLKPAMDYYFKEYGDDYIERKKVVKAIGEFKGLLARSLSTKANRESKIQELNRQIAEEENKYKAFNEKWKTIGKNFKMYMEKEDWISTLNPETIDSMYHTLWYANLKGTFVEESLLKKGKSINCPSSWDAQTSKWANYIVRFFECIVTFTVDYSGRYEEPFIDLVDYFVDGQIVLLESSLEIKLNMSQPVGFYGKMPKEKVITTATPPTDDGKTGIISREDLDVIQTSEGMAYIINHFITGLGNNGPLAGVSIYNANEDYLATDGVTNYRRIRDAIQKLNPSPIN